MIAGAAMTTERDKMLRGELYLATAPELVAGRVRARRLCAELNGSDAADVPEWAGPRPAPNQGSRHFAPSRAMTSFATSGPQVPAA